jgi:hypothetical protein
MSGRNRSRLSTERGTLPQVMTTLRTITKTGNRYTD